MQNVAGAMLGGFALLSLIVLRLGSEAVWQARLARGGLLQTGPLDFVPRFDFVLLYGAIAVGVVLMAWPAKKN